MGVRGAVSTYSLGLSGLGAAVSVCVGPFRASLPGAGQTAQEDDRVGLAVALVGQALASGARDRGRRRWRIRLIETLGSLPPVVQPHYPHHTPGVGCCPLRACPATLSRADRKTSLKGERLANLSLIVEAPSTLWRIVTLADWYEKEECTVEVVSSPRSGTVQDCPPCRCDGC